MPVKPPRLPDEDDLPEIEVDDEFDASLPIDVANNDRMSAEADVSDSLEDISAISFDDLPQDGPLNFNDGTDMGHPRGNTERQGGTWKAQGGDSGELQPPTEILSKRNGPSVR